MRGKKRKRSGSGAICLILAGSLAVYVLTFGGRMLWRFLAERIPFQAVVSLEGVERGEAFEEELEKIPGFCSLDPVIEVPVRLEAEGYTMDAILIGVDLDRLEKQVSRSGEVPVGTAPALLIGEESLAAMTDRNGHPASEEKQRELLERYGEIRWQDCLTGEAGGTEAWRPCLVAATLHAPSGEIYMPYAQAETLTGKKETNKFLLTVRGKENHERALEYFGG